MKSVIKRLKTRFVLDAASKRYIEFNRKKWRRDPAPTGDSVVLVDFFDSNCQIHGFSHVANFLAKRLNGSIEAYSFDWGKLRRMGVPRLRLQKIYESFGAKIGLTYSSKVLSASEARRRVTEMLAKVKTKADVIALKFDDLEVGDLIYDSYLREGRATVDLDDAAFKEIVVDAYLIYAATKDYFARKNVRAVFSIHSTYIWYGITIRMAMQRKIPVFFISPEIFRIFEVSPKNYHFWAFHDFPQIFRGFDKAKQIEARKKAAAALENRFSGNLDPTIPASFAGKLDSTVSSTLQAGPVRKGGYGAVKSVPLLKQTGRPRGLVLLHCFFDAPHCFGPIVFEDFWEWSCFILENAAKTDFDWYVKGHPDGLKGNNKVIAELQRKFPKACFLDPSSSNRQIVAEGINAMFTVYGSAGHEFAYMGVPVVTAGSNPHSAYNFNIHAKNKDEVASYVANLDKINLNINRAEIEECCYLWYYHFQGDLNELNALMIDEQAWFTSVGLKAFESGIFDEYMKAASAERDKKVDAYLELFFSKYFPAAF